MTIKSGVVAVGSVPTQINGASTNPIRLHIHNNDTTDELFLGNGTVAVNSGLVLGKLESIELILNPGETLFAVVSGQKAHSLSWLSQED